MKYTVEDIQEKYKTLPDDIKSAITSTHVENRLHEIAKKHNLHIDQEGELMDETGLVMLGLTPPQNFVKNIMSRLHINYAKSGEIVGDINEQIFIEVRESLKRVHRGELEKPKTDPETIKETNAESDTIQTPKREEILKEIEDTDPGEAESGEKETPSTSTTPNLAPQQDFMKQVTIGEIPSKHEPIGKDPDTEEIEQKNPFSITRSMASSPSSQTQEKQTQEKPDSHISAVHKKTEEGNGQIPRERHEEQKPTNPEGQSPGANQSASLEKIYKQKPEEKSAISGTEVPTPFVPEKTDSRTGYAAPQKKPLLPVPQKPIIGESKKTPVPQTHTPPAPDHATPNAIPAKYPAPVPKSTLQKKTTSLPALTTPDKRIPNIKPDTPSTQHTPNNIGKKDEPKILKSDIPALFAKPEENTPIARSTPEKPLNESAPDIRTADPYREPLD